MFAKLIKWYRKTLQMQRDIYSEWYPPIYKNRHERRLKKKLNKK